MVIDFKPVVLDVDSGDSSGVLIFRDQALLAVAAKLGPGHDELAGSWFVEVVFHPVLPAPREPFPDLPALEAWLTARLADAR